MKITLRPASRKPAVTYDVCVPQALAIAAGAVLGLSGLVLWGGYLLGERFGEQTRIDAATAQVYELLEAERDAIADVRAEHRAHLDALALKVAELQAHLMRVDALGERLVDVGKLDSGEFDFSSAPPVGGADEALPGDGQNASELSIEMGRIAGMLSDREEKLGLLEQMLMTRDVKAEVTPSGRPLIQGWVSSGYGRRTDPFTGKKARHLGIDFAGKPGSEVVAVASGIVTRSRRVPSYGNVIEIRHADGYSTLYGHNKTNLVHEGEMVSKGQTIALLGSTGRSSGPHVHFEVLHNGKHVDPQRFVNARD